MICKCRDKGNAPIKKGLNIMQVSRKPITLVFISHDSIDSSLKWSFWKQTIYLSTKFTGSVFYFTYRRSDWRNDQHLFFHLFVCLFVKRLTTESAVYLNNEGYIFNRFYRKHFIKYCRSFSIAHAQTTNSICLPVRPSVRPSARPPGILCEQWRLWWVCTFVQARLSLVTVPKFQWQFVCQ